MGEGKLLLLVEDEAIIALSERKTLENAGYQVDHVYTGEQAVERVADHRSPPIDLILMDIDLGRGISGTEAAEQILKDHVVPVVFLTSHAEREVVEQVRTITRYGYVVKTAGSFVLLGAVETALELFAAQQSSLRELVRNRAILHAMPDLVFVLDREGYFREAHVPPGTPTVVPPAQIIGSHISTVFDAEETQRHLEAYRRAIDTGEIQVLTYTLARGEGIQTFESRVSRLDGHLVLAIVRDISSQTAREQAIREEQLFLAKLLDRIPGLAIQGYRRDGTVIYWNRESEELYGYPREDALGNNLVDLIIPEPMRAAVRMNVARMVDSGDGGEPERLTLRNAHGEAVEVESTHTIIDLPSREPALFCIDVPLKEQTDVERDLARRLQFQELVARISQDFMRTPSPATGTVVRRAMELFGRFFDVQRCYIFSFDSSRTTMRQTFEWCAPGVESFQDVQQDVVIQEYLAVLEPVLRGEPLLLGDVRNLPVHATAPNRRFEEERVKAALLVPMVAAQGPVGYMGMHVLEEPRRWTTEEVRQARVLAEMVARALARQEMGRELRFEQRLMRVLLEHSPDLVYFKDRESIFLRMSRSLAHLHSLADPDEGIGLSDADRMDADEAAARRATEQQIMETGVPQVGLEERQIWPDGTTHWVSSSKVPFHDDEGNLLGLFGISRDITATKEAETRLREYAREQELLLREVHHRVKNTMATIRGLISLQAGTIADPAVQAHLQELQDRVVGMLTVYDHLDSASDFRSVALAAYLEDLVAAVQCAMSSNVPIEIHTELAECTLDSKIVFPLGLIVNELLTNARKYAFSDGDPGSITLVSRSAAEGQWESRVEDNGVGLDAVPQGGHRRTGGGSGGFGLGLVESLASQIGGTFTITAAHPGEQRPGVSAVVTFRYTSQQETRPQETVQQNTRRQENRQSDAG